MSRRGGWERGGGSLCDRAANGDEQGKRQVNDKHDAQVMCRRLSEYLDGHGKALSMVPDSLAGGGGAPGGRSDARAIRRELRGIQAMGRSLLLQAEVAVTGRWWKGRSWVGIGKAIPPWMVAPLESWKEVIELLEKRALAKEGQLQATAPVPSSSLGRRAYPGTAGPRTDRPPPFKPPRWATAGLCPSESTSDERRRLGSITKHGNPRLRRLMVEIGLADQPLSAALPSGAPLGSSPRGSESVCRRPQESHRRPRASSGRRPLADGHWSGPGRRTGLRAKSQRRLASEELLCH